MWYKRTTLHFTDVHFVNNTATHTGGGMNIMDDSSVGNHINISNSSIIGGMAQDGGGVCSIGAANHIVERKWNDSEYCNTITTRINVWNLPTDQ